MTNYREAISVTVKLLYFAALAAGLLSSSVAAQAQGPGAQERVDAHRLPFSNNMLSQQARLNIDRAEAMALQTAPGITKEIELGLENGKLVYSVEIEQTPGKTVEVVIDARNCQVVKVENESESTSESKEKSASSEKKK
jgi:uncharacterized membrane protein YkoI